ncbi:MAG TPA: molybdopterin molybdotransferase MoeA [Conexivisphaerales archaeon]|nr:molybdopterin molybdotransferase MoeA [Conexivisphaerales archaeon]
MPAKVLRIPFEEAVERLKANLGVRSPSEVPVQDCLGRRLATDLVSRWALPRYDVSHLDGYAVRAQDLAAASAGSPVLLKVAGVSRPDGQGPADMKAGVCVRVLTGGRMPEGADAVVPQEATEKLDDHVAFREAVAPLSNIHRAGSDVQVGMVLFKKGHVINARDLSFILSYGLATLMVDPVIRVGILATGNELVEKDRGPVPGKVIESNRMVLGEILRSSAFEVQDLGLAQDDVADIASRLRSAQGRCDAVLTTGGSSVSEADLVPEALSVLGAVKVFHGLLLRPSRTLGAYMLEGMPVFLLSGLIQGGVSAFCNAVYPSLRYMAGDGWQELPAVRGTITKPLQSIEGDKFRLVTWVRLKSEGGRLFAEPMSAPSTTRFVLTKVNGFLVREPGKGIEEGELVDIRLPYGFDLEDALGGL